MAELPVVQEVTPVPTVPDVLSRFADLEGVVLFESVRTHKRLARYSFLVAQPFQISELQTPAYGVNPFHDVEAFGKSYSAKTIPGLPPFQGGFAGLLSYDLGRCWERLPVPDIDDFEIPACVIGVYDWVIAWDHLQQKCWIISHGFSKESSQPTSRKAQETCEEILHRIRQEDLSFDSNRAHTHIEVLSKSHPLSESPGVASNFSKSSYLSAVQKVIDYIYDGDIFQANLSQRFVSESAASPLAVYQSLREHNPAPFAGFIKFGDWSVHSSSPEQFVCKTENRVRTRPIKGTRQRRLVPEADLYTRDELRESEKDQAENVMIVDLMRNDLSRVCLPGTIRVPELCTIEAYETVTHLVSEVTGVLQPSATFWDVIRATFPGGSITGAPKIRAMEIITELERVARGPYCGAMFYLGFDGSADSNILIRTITQRGSKLSFPAGGGVVSQSVPKSEYEETLHKSAGIREAILSLSEA